MLDLDALEVEAKANLYCQWDMSPKIVLSLIARVRELEADLGRLAFRKNWYESLEAALARVRELEVERNRLAADVAMLRPGTARVSALVDRGTGLTLGEGGRAQNTGGWAGHARTVISSCSWKPARCWATGSPSHE